MPRNSEVLQNTSKKRELNWTMWSWIDEKLALFRAVSEEIRSETALVSADNFLIRGDQPWNPLRPQSGFGYFVNSWDNVWINDPIFMLHLYCPYSRTNSNLLFCAIFFRIRKAKSSSQIGAFFYPMFANWARAKTMLDRMKVFSPKKARKS